MNGEKESPTATGFNGEAPNRTNSDGDGLIVPGDIADTSSSDVVLVDNELRDAQLLLVRLEKLGYEAPDEKCEWTLSASDVTHIRRILARDYRDTPFHLRTFEKLVAFGLLGETHRALSATEQEDLAAVESLKAKIRLNERAWREHDQEDAEAYDLPDVVTSALDFLERSDVEYEWTIPGRLPKKSRLIITGFGGSGKSSLNYWISFSAAAGQDPFEPETRDRYKSQRVLIVDVENPELVIRDRLQRLVTTFEQMGVERSIFKTHVFIESRPGGLDLGDPAERAWLERVIELAQPDLLYIGPTYKLSVHNENFIDFFKTIIGALDDLRTRYGFSLLLEAHLPHPSAEGPPIIRPVGSGGWTRWPELGLYLGKNGLKPWRPSRYGGAVDWPTHLTRDDDLEVRFSTNKAAKRGDIELTHAQQVAAALLKPMNKHLRDVLEALGDWTELRVLLDSVPNNLFGKECVQDGARRKAVNRALEELRAVDLAEGKSAQSIGRTGNKTYWRLVPTSSDGTPLNPLLASMAPSAPEEQH